MGHMLPQVIFPCICSYLIIPDGFFEVVDIFRFGAILKKKQREPKIIKNCVLEAQGFVDRVPDHRFFYSPKGRRLSIISKWFYEIYDFV